MGSLCNESFEEFLRTLKAAGIAISNEAELRERLAEARRWQYAFMTLAANGRPLGIRFSEDRAGSDKAMLHNTLASFQFPDNFDAVFVANLQSEH